jgi:hypothetical protein
LDYRLLDECNYKLEESILLLKLKVVLKEDWNVGVPLWNRNELVLHQ